MTDTSNIEHLAVAVREAREHSAEHADCDTCRDRPRLARIGLLLAAYDDWVQSGMHMASGLAFAATSLADHHREHAENCVECSDLEANLGDTVADFDFPLEQQGE